MEYVSIPRGALAARWRPVNQMGSRQWQPTPPRLALAPPASRLGQVHPLSVADVGVDFLGSIGTMAVGFGLALWGPKDSPTWRWLGGLIGSIGTMRALHNVTKLGL